MIRPKTSLSQQPPAKQILAVVLAWLAIVATLPTTALPSPLPVPHARFSSALAAAAQAQGTAPVQPPLPPKPSPQKGQRQQEEADKWGEITVGQPKIWQYERVNSLLDGLLRDVEGVSMSDLLALNPNANNAAAVRLVQSMLEVGVKYDQQAAVTNQINLENYRATQSLASSAVDANKAYLQQLYSQRTEVTNELTEAMKLNSSLQQQLAKADPTKTDAYKAVTTQQTAAATQVSTLQTNLSTINGQITSATSASIPAPPTLTSTAAGTAPETANTFSDFLSKLPSKLTDNIYSQMQSPSFPATKQLDNFITLLYERLAREISVLQDDVVRDPENVAYLVQFDVGLYPSDRAKNHVGVVEFKMDCQGCKVYSIYPGQSSYNISNYEGASKRYSLWGAVQTLFGFGISADYRRQVDTLHGDLVQSVYMSGFQEGAAQEDRNGTHSPAQLFGWYYGASPFETEVTPGIRSTFALVSVPRKSITSCMNSKMITGEKCLAGLELDGGGTDVNIKMSARADWVRRDDPYFQKPGWHRDYVKRIENTALTKNLEVVLPGTDALKNASEIVLGERGLLHVTGIEYNTVYLQSSSTPANGRPDSTASSTPNGTPPTPGAATPNSTGNGGATPAANAPVPKVGDGSPSTDPFTGCAKNQCAAVLIKLAEPIDPNLVVTVGGEPLRRVRDWRGRATSVLPPVQSQSDIPPAPSGTPAGGSANPPQRSENPKSRSLLEVDGLEPNTWMEVDSHRLLLTVSEDLAGEEAFPSIQIIDPTKKAFFIPIDLDEGFSEIIINDFHLPIRNKFQLASFIGNRLRYDHQFRLPGSDLRNVHFSPGGPYAYTTFLPLFMKRPQSKGIYAYLGGTGVQLLIGFLGDSTSSGQSGPPTRYEWLPDHAQVILEDSVLDLAWSLSCYGQGENLVCDVPQSEIRDAYRIVADQCPSEDCPGISRASRSFPSISTLQVWVEQSDPDGRNSFITTSPAKLGQFPVQAGTDSTGPDVGFSPWHFELAVPNGVVAVGCQYPDFPPQENSTITVLGQHIPTDFRTQIVKGAVEIGCSWFTIPTVALTRPEIVVRYPIGPRSTLPGQSIDRGSIPIKADSDQCLSPKTSCRPESLVAALFAPSFGRPAINPLQLEGRNSVSQWRIEIPVSHVDCHDSLDSLELKTVLNPKWKIGTATYDLGDPGNTSQAICTPSPTFAAPPDWNQTSKTTGIRLVFDIKKETLKAVLNQGDIHLIRGRDQIPIAKLPDLVSDLLPRKLTLSPVSNSQFSLEGPHAEVLDSVTLLGPGGPFGPYPTATGPGVALVSLPQPSGKTAAPGPGTYTIAPLISWKKDGKDQYLSLEVKDPQGNALTYTIAEPSKK